MTHCGKLGRIRDAARLAEPTTRCSTSYFSEHIKAAVKRYARAPTTNAAVAIAPARWRRLSLERVVLVRKSVM